VCVDAPKSLADAEMVSLRRQALTETHVAPLVTFVHQLRKFAPSGVPDFDPSDGGIHAECLFLLEAPGAKAIGSGFISRNNPDETAKNFFLLNAEAGLSRVRTITWNAVPWYIGSDTKIRAAGSADLRAARTYLCRLLLILPHLKVVVLVGRKAQRFADFVKTIAPTVSVFRCPHPSPLSLNGRPERRAEILNCLSSVVQLLEKVPGTSPNNRFERSRVSSSVGQGGDR